VTAPLFQRQSTGGVVARDGFDYQDAFLLQHIPLYLSQGAFSHAVSELLGDVEVRYHRPGGGTFCVLHEAKRNQLTTNAFWAEVARFIELHDAAPDEYVRFVLVCGNFNGDFDPLFRKLERYRGPAESLNSDSSIRASAEADIEATIVGLGQTAAVARFVLERVSFVKYSDADVAGAFASMLAMHLPTMADMRGGEVGNFRGRCKELVDGSTKGLVSRRSLETALVESAPDLAPAWLGVATKLRLLPEPPARFEELSLEVGPFNGPARGALAASKWVELQEQLTATGQFIHSSRERRGVLLSAKQRMSLACTAGYCLSATRGFTLQMDHNGQVLDTASHARSSDKFFELCEEVPDPAGDEGVASISFPYPGQDDVLATARGLGLTAAPKLFLASGAALTDIGVLNTAVNESKAALASFRARHGLTRVHLFIKAPSVFAMALGYRLNGVGTLQLYDWVDVAYKPTAELQ
jgi:SMODS-associated and fused to various effectors sensor domain